MGVIVLGVGHFCHPQHRFVILIAVVLNNRFWILIAVVRQQSFRDTVALMDTMREACDVQGLDLQTDYSQTARRIESSLTLISQISRRDTL